MLLRIINNSITETATLNIAAHVHQRLETFSYRKDIPSNATALAFLSSQDIEASKNITIVNMSDKVAENSPEKTFNTNDFYKITGSSFTTSYPEVSITNQYTLDSKGNVIPFFYGESLQNNTSSISIERVTNKKSEQVKFGYILSEDKTRVYYNFKNTYDLVTGLYELYFITTISTTSQITRSLINPSSAIRESTWEDVDSETGELDTTIPLYFKEEINNQTTYYFNEADTYYIKVEDGSYLSPLKISSSAKDGWFPIIRNGKFHHIVNNTNNYYSIVESSNVPYFPYTPYLFDSYVSYSFITKNILSLNRKYFGINTTDRPLKIIVRNQNQEVIYALTTKSSLDGQLYSSTIYWNTSIINSWDNINGIIELNINVDDSWDLEISGYYEQKDYTYTEINLNPLYNNLVYNYYYVLYIKPNETERSLHRLLVRNDGVIVDTSDDNYKLLDIDGNYNSSTFINKTYRITGGNYQTDDFINLYTIDGINTYNWMILGEYYFVETYSSKEIDIVNLPISGDALVSRDAVFRNPKLTQSKYLYGYFGLEYPVNNVLIYRLSYSLLEDYGGDFTLDSIKESLETYIGASKHIIFEWDEYINDITVDNSTGLVLYWNSVGYGYSYKIYRSEIKDSGYELIDTVYNGSSELSFNDTTVTSNKVYYYYIVPSKNNIDFPQSITIGAVVH